MCPFFVTLTWLASTHEPAIMQHKILRAQPVIVIGHNICLSVIDQNSFKVYKAGEYAGVSFTSRKASCSLILELLRKHIATNCIMFYMY